jgi:hypothetical protein
MIRRGLLTLVVALGTASVAFGGDVSGRWVGSVDTPDGPLELTYELKVEGETLSGTVTSAMGTVALSNGKVSGPKLTYDVQIEMGTITHEATVNDAGDEIAVKATGDWGTSEYVVKRVAETK